AAASDCVEGAGVSEVGPGRVSEQRTAASLMPIDPVRTGTGRRAAAALAADRPLVSAIQGLASRTYGAFAIDKRGGFGPLSGRVSVPLAPPPAPPSSPTVIYSETS